MKQGGHLNLPHIDMKGYYQFITFRIKESIDSYLKQLYANKYDSEKIKQYKMDQYLDKSINGAFLNGSLIQEIQNYYFNHHGKEFDLYAVTIMPNHIHALVKQKSSLSDIVRILKGGSAHIINKRLNRTGKVWSSDYFDKVIRDEKHFQITYEYIKHNAFKAKLEDAKERFYGYFE
ncbi:transposase [Sulfurovum sp. NBC37-1]|uniref:transposase n=1 Tax=Sulfurovum sp. (strain NBC37-1) TaxID=387093 RepID=UPI0005A2C8A4|nr:transposase [Sulfurovum sp. NBC37-1]